MCQPCCQTPRPSQFKHHQPSLTPFTYTQAIANRLPDYTYSVPGMLFYFLDPGHTAGGFRLHERCYFDKKDLEVDMQGKVRAAVVVLCMCCVRPDADPTRSITPIQPDPSCVVIQQHQLTHPSTPTQPDPEQQQSVLVAGGNAGIGRSAAQSLAQLGATVHILCRSREKGEQAVKDIQVGY